MTTSLQQTCDHAMRVAATLHRQGLRILTVAVTGSRRPTIALDASTVPAGMTSQVYRSGPLRNGRRYYCHTANIDGCQARWFSTRPARAGRITAS